MKLDSVFSNLLEVPFPDDAPLIPVTEINRALDAIEQASRDRQVQILTEQTDNLLQRATPFLVNRDAAGIAALDWNVGVALQAPIYSVWSMGWQLGSTHMIREMVAAVPGEARQKAEGKEFATVIDYGDKLLSFATPQELVQVAALLRMEPGLLVNTAAEQAVLRRVLRLAGNFSNDQLARVKLSLIGAISPDSTGKVLSRKELLEQIQQNLQVGKVRSEMIARTELTNAYNTSRVQTALQSELVTHLRFLAISDARTTPICRSRNGMLISVRDQGAIAANKPALHVKCRSTLSPVMASINPRHQQWVEDPERDWQQRDLIPLPQGWQ
jgi:SPP1 gp7 family putative phage head morphogenesis protein